MLDQNTLQSAHVDATCHTTQLMLAFRCSKDRCIPVIQVQVESSHFSDSVTIAKLGFFFFNQVFHVAWRAALSTSAVPTGHRGQSMLHHLDLTTWNGAFGRGAVLLLRDDARQFTGANVLQT